MENINIMDKIFLLFLLLFTQQSFSSERCFPSSTLKFPANLKSLNGISESEFKQILERVQMTMGGEVKKFLNKKLIINGVWNDSTIDAHATRDETNNPVIIINGGLAMDY